MAAVIASLTMAAPAIAQTSGTPISLKRFTEALDDPTIRLGGLSDAVYCLGNWTAWSDALDRDIETASLPDSLMKDNAIAQQEHWASKVKLGLAREGRRRDYASLAVTATDAAATQLTIVGEEFFLGELGACYVSSAAAMEASFSQMDGAKLRIMRRGDYDEWVKSAETPVVLAVAPRDMASRKMLARDLRKVAGDLPQVSFLLADPEDLGDRATDMELERFPVLILLNAGEEQARTVALYDRHGYADWVRTRLALLPEDES